MIFLLFANFILRAWRLNPPCRGQDRVIKNNGGITIIFIKLSDNADISYSLMFFLVLRLSIFVFLFSKGGLPWVSVIQSLWWVGYSSRRANNKIPAPPPPPPAESPVSVWWPSRWPFTRCGSIIKSCTGHDADHTTWFSWSLLQNFFWLMLLRSIFSLSRMWFTLPRRLYGLINSLTLHCIFFQM